MMSIYPSVSQVPIGITAFPVCQAHTLSDTWNSVQYNGLVQGQAKAW